MKTMYKGDTRYEKVYEQMQLLGIQDVSTERQVKNGTIVWRLPILSDKPDTYIEYASFKSGYVRNQGVDCHSNWQINKRKQSEPMYYPEYEWKGGYQVKKGKYYKHEVRTCERIPVEIDRLEYLISYCLKNYYIKLANQVADGEFIPKWVYQDVYEQAKNAKAPEVKVIVNGHRYNVI